MHNQIMNPPKGMEVDHRDRDGLHNWRENLRVCTHAQNSMNRGPSSVTGFKGVRLYGSKKYIAQIKFRKKFFHLGIFTEAEEAARAYDAAAKKFFGDFAWLNFPDK